MTSKATAPSVTVGAVLVAVFAPKCPMCIAGWLSVVGLGASAPLLAPAIRPLAIVLALGSAFWVVRRIWRGRHRDHRECNRAKNACTSLVSTSGFESG